VSIDAALVAFAEASRDDLSRLLMAASRAVNEKVLTEIDPEGASGVRLAHVPVIAALDPGGTRLGDLAPRIGVTRQAVAALTKDLDALGVVVCEPDPRDGRATIVRLTAKGAAFCDSAVAAMTRREAELASTLGTDGLRQLRSTLRHLAGDDEEPR
jgi:DNA-binding MarR family transcriptional regulator